jgi:LPXTG-motif cell wall-anchored protein
MRSGNSGLGAADHVELVDPIPATLKVLSVDPGRADAGLPSWQSCDVTGRDGSGYGGTLVCTLDRPLGALQSAPAVTLTTLLSPRAGFGPITNTAHVSGTEISVDLPTLADPEDSATIWTAGAALASTGIDPRALIAAAALLLLLGFGALIAVRRRRRTAREAG